MFKKAARFQQRLGVMIGSGLFNRDPLAPDDSGQRLSPIEQVHLKERLRLARIRRAFEIESQIASDLKQGKNVARLREELAKVKAGEIKIPLSLANEPRQSPDFVGITSARKAGPALVPHTSASAKRGRRKQLVTPATVAGGLKDLAKSKLTLEGIALVKVMLDRFDIAEVSAALRIPEDYLGRIRQSAVYLSAPRINPADALVIVDVLEEQLAARFRLATSTATAKNPRTERSGGNLRQSGASVDVATDKRPTTIEQKPSDSVSGMGTHGGLVPQACLSAPGEASATVSSSMPPDAVLERHQQTTKPESLEDLQERLQGEFGRLEDLFARRGKLQVELQRYRDSVASLEDELHELDAEIDELIRTI